MKTFDVVAVNLETNRVRFIATDKSERAAESIENMAVYRRGVETECFATDPHVRAHRKRINEQKHPTQILSGGG